jgi:nicotinate-nucleotide pyrophosphorylase (carboxylating)
MVSMFEKTEVRRIIETALREDIGPGDVTTGAVLTGLEVGKARAVAKTELVVAGLDVFKEVFVTLDPEVRFVAKKKDGQKVRRGAVVAEVSGRLKSILQAERVALNLFQRMCGVATLTRRYTDLVKGTEAKILDTRKTAPGLRILDKYAVRVGGGVNHRFALYDGVLIKNNHIDAVGGIKAALTRAKAKVGPLLKVEVEVRDFGEVKEAVAAGADMIMLDNMGISDMNRAVRFVAGRIPVEASGNVSLESVRGIAETGVDFLSVGALTHSVAAADISLTVFSVGRKSEGKRRR